MYAMQNRSLLLPFIIIILVFASYSALHPLAKLLPTKEYTDYSLPIKK